MKSTINRWLACLLAVSMLCSFILVPVGAENSGLLSYPEAVARFNSISLTDEAELLLVRESLATVGNRYFAPQYRIVTDALLALARNEEARFAELELGLNMLGTNKAFTDDYQSYDSLAFLPFDALLGYIAARKLEAEGKMQEAFDTYAQVQVLDSLERGIRLIVPEHPDILTADHEITDETITALEANITERDALLAESYAKLTESETMLANLAAQLAERDVELAAASEERDTLKAEKIIMLEAISAEKNTMIAEWETKLAEKEARLAELETKLAECETLRAE